MGICLKFSAKPKFLKSYEPLEFSREKIMLSSRTQQKQTNKALFPKFWGRLWILDKLVILQNIEILKHSWF